MPKLSEVPSIYAAALEEIERTRGKVTPDIVVEVARNPDHVLHSAFEWSDDKAAIQWRRAQAREIIATARLTVELHEVSFVVPAYLRDPQAPSDTQGYVNVRTLAHDRGLAEQAIATELRQAAAFLRRARDLARASGLSVDTIETLEDTVGSLATTMFASDAAADVAA